MLRRHTLAIIVGIIPVLLAGVSISLAWRQRGTDTVESTLDRYLTTGQVNHEDDQLIWNTAQLFLADTPYARTLTINDYPRQGALNFYVFRDDPARRFAGFSCNCQYLNTGKSDVIVCDHALLAYFRRLLEDRDPDRGRLAIQNSVLQDPADGSYYYFNGERYPLAKVRSVLGQLGHQQLDSTYDLLMQNFSTSLLAWIVGHEIGHIIRGDSEAVADQYVIEHTTDTNDAAYMYLTLHVSDTEQHGTYPVRRRAGQRRPGLRRSGEPPYRALASGHGRDPCR
jgi:hypothetical protein